MIFWVLINLLMVSVSTEDRSDILGFNQLTHGVCVDGG